MRPDAFRQSEPAWVAAERAARESYGKLVAFLAARGRDVAGAEDALGDAFAAALAAWPLRGVPANPEGWLVMAARRKLTDAARRRRKAQASGETLALIAEELETAERETIPDRRLALMFACAHPAIDLAVRAPLMLQSILGLDAAAIGSAFLVSPAAMGQRLARAKAKIRLAGVPFRIPGREDLPERLAAVLEAIYAAFSHGWDEGFSDDPSGRDLAEEAIWLGRTVVSLAPDEPEAEGLLALMLHAHGRRRARRDALGRYVPLERAGHNALGRGRNRRGRAASATGERGEVRWPVPARSGRAVRARRTPDDRRHRLGGDRRPLRHPVRADRLAGRRDQSGGGRVLFARAGGGTRAPARGLGRRPTGWVRALLGRQGGPQRKDRGPRRSPAGLHRRDRIADRPGGAGVSRSRSSERWTEPPSFIFMKPYDFVGLNPYCREPFP